MLQKFENVPFLVMSKQLEITVLMLYLNCRLHNIPAHVLFIAAVSYLCVFSVHSVYLFGEGMYFPTHF